MNAYEIDIWRGVKHNGVFSHNDVRVELVHARNEEEAREKITLREGYIHNSFGACDLVIEVSSETIYSCRKIGTVCIKPFYVYSDGRSPVLVSEKVRK
jgi:hypothetical protein